MDTQKFFRWSRSKKNLLEILKDRGYNQEELEFSRQALENLSIDCSLDEFKKSLEEVHGDDQLVPKIFLHWSEFPKLGTNLRSIFNKMELLGVKRAIIVADESITSHAKKTLRSIRKTGYHIDVYTLNESQINITNHVYVPKHRLCTDEEKKKHTKIYRLKPSQYPEIKRTDPLVRHFGAKKGDLFEITRKSDTQAGLPALYYRIVI